MSNAINKVVYAGRTLIDLTGDTTTADEVLVGNKFHGADGVVYDGTCTYDSDTSDATAAQAELLTGKTAYVRGTKITGTMPNRGGNGGGTISTKTGSVTIAQGYHDGSAKVQISSTEQAKLIASNIKSGVVLLGVTGTLTPSSDVKAEAVTVTSSSIDQYITPSGDYDYISQVTVQAIPYSEVLNAAGGYTATIDESHKMNV